MLQVKADYKAQSPGELLCPDLRAIAPKSQSARVPTSPTIVGEGSSSSSVLSMLTDLGASGSFGSRSLSPTGTTALPPLDFLGGEPADESALDRCWTASSFHGQLPADRIGAVTPLRFSHYRALEENRLQRAALEGGTAATPPCLRASPPTARRSARSNIMPLHYDRYHAAESAATAPVVPTVKPLVRRQRSRSPSAGSSPATRHMPKVMPTWRVNELVRWREQDTDKRL